MDIFEWVAPDEIIGFICDQFERYEVPYPSDRCLDEIAAYMLCYIAKTEYWPRTETEAEERFYEDPPRGLSEPERQAMVPEIEIHLKLHLRETITDVQLHLCLWAALLYCWTEEGMRYVAWYQRVELGPKDTLRITP